MNVINAIKLARPGETIYRKINPGHKYTLPERPIESTTGGYTHIFLDLFFWEGYSGAGTSDFWMLADDWEVNRGTRNRRT